MLPPIPAIKPPYCFGAGTLIDMADGSNKSVEEVLVGDEILAYDDCEAKGRAALKPSPVTQTFTNTVSTILDFHGLMVTPGHVTLCGDGPYEGQHRPLFDIIRDDGAVVDRDGKLIRAATNCPVGSEGDRFVEVAYTPDESTADLKRGRIRAGTLLLTDDGNTTSVLESLEQEGYALQPDGLVAKDGEASHPLYWFGGLPKPEDYVLKKSGLTLDELYSDPDAMAEPARIDAVTGASWNDRTGARVTAAASRKKAGNTLH